MLNDLLKEKGFSFRNGEKFLPLAKDGKRIAMDAAISMVTAPNVTVPQMFQTYIDPTVIETLTAPRKSTEIFPEAKVCDWADQQVVFRQNEKVGSTQPYSDFGKGTTAEVNYNFESRGIYRFQDFIQVGDLEQDIMGKMRVNLLSDKQAAATETIAIDANRFNLFGVANAKIYGLLNEPNLLAAITPLNVGTVETPVTAWADKTPTQIHDDILEMVGTLVDRTEGLVQYDTPMVLAIPPSLSTYLLKASMYGVAPVMEMLKARLPNVTVKVLPELKDETGVCSALLCVQNLGGKPVGKFGFADKLRTSRVILDHTSMSQKWSSSTNGFILYQPLGIVRMTGLQKS